MLRSEWMARMLRTQRVTLEILDRIQKHTDFDYKQVTALDLADYKASPTWFGGIIEIGYNNDPESIAHELAHGLHEKIRETGKSNTLGEEFAEAIRYYVEVEMKSDSEWLRKFNHLNNPFTMHYDLPRFISALKDGSLFKDVGW